MVSGHRKGSSPLEAAGMLKTNGGLEKGSNQSQLETKWKRGL